MKENTTTILLNAPLNRNKSLAARIWCDLRSHYQLYLMVLPAFTLLILFHYLPIYGLQLAFRTFTPSKGLIGGDWVGLDYFKKFINSFQFANLIKNTFTISLTTLLINFPLPIVLALFFNQIRSKSRKNTMQTLAYLPHFISTVALVGMARILLSPSNGLWGHLHALFGLEAMNIMASPEAFKWIYSLSTLWQNVGWNSIIYIAALASIDVQLYDAAKVDGANRWQQMIHIDIPSIIPTIVVLLILVSGRLMSVGFEMVYLLQTDPNLAASEVISTYTFKIGIISNQISYSTAIGLFNNLINFIILFTVNRISRKVSDISLF